MQQADIAILELQTQVESTKLQLELAVKQGNKYYEESDPEKQAEIISEHIEATKAGTPASVKGIGPVLIGKILSETQDLFIETSKQLALTNEELEQKENQVIRLEDQLSEGDTCMVELQNRFQVQEEEKVQVSGLFDQKRLEWESKT